MLNSAPIPCVIELAISSLFVNVCVKSIVNSPLGYFFYMSVEFVLYHNLLFLGCLIWICSITFFVTITYMSNLQVASIIVQLVFSNYNFLRMFLYCNI